MRYTSQSYCTIHWVWCGRDETKRCTTEKAAATDILAATVPILHCGNNGMKNMVHGETDTFTYLYQQKMAMRSAWEWTMKSRTEMSHSNINLITISNTKAIYLISSYSVTRHHILTLVLGTRIGQWNNFSWCSAASVTFMCPVKWICWGTTDPEDHNMTGHVFLPDITEMSQTTNWQCNITDDLNLHQQHYKILKSHYWRPGQDSNQV